MLHTVNMAVPEYLAAGKALEATSFAQDENELYTDTINVLSTMYDTFGTPLSEIFQKESATLKKLAQVAKADFKELFGGTFMSVGFNAIFPRAASFLSQGSTTPVETFVSAGATTLGWGGLFGSESSPYNTGLSTGNTNTSTYTYDNVSYGLTGLISYGSPKISEMKLYLESVKYPIFKFAPVKLGGEAAVYYLKFPRPIYLKRNTTFAIEANYTALGQIDIEPFGLQFSKSEYLQYK